MADLIDMIARLVCSAGEDGMARPLTVETRRSVIAEERMVFVRAKSNVHAMRARGHEGTILVLCWAELADWLNLGAGRSTTTRRRC